MLNRIIGILVVLAIGILISPFVFKNTENTLLTETLKEPPFPNQIAQNETIQALKEMNRSPIAFESAKKGFVKYHGIKTNDSNLSEMKHTKTKNIAWVIQVGTFKNKVDAFRLVNTLRSKGYNAFIHQSKVTFGEEMRVYIGPEGKRDSAELLVLKLAKEIKLSGVVKSYKPLML